MSGASEPQKSRLSAIPLKWVKTRFFQTEIPLKWIFLAASRQYIVIDNINNYDSVLHETCFVQINSRYSLCFGVGIISLLTLSFGIRIFISRRYHRSEWFVIAIKVQRMIFGPSSFRDRPVLRKAWIIKCWWLSRRSFQAAETHSEWYKIVFETKGRITKRLCEFLCWLCDNTCTEHSKDGPRSGPKRNITPKT